MDSTVAHLWSQCNRTLRTLRSATSSRDAIHDKIVDHSCRFNLWAGNIGAQLPSDNPMSLESRLAQSSDLKRHVEHNLETVLEIGNELLQLNSTAESDRIEQLELIEELDIVISDLFRFSKLARRIEPEALFTKALSRHHHVIDPAPDLSHVRERFTKLGTGQNEWLLQRLARAITDRRQFLRYASDHQKALSREVQEVGETDEMTKAPVIEDSSSLQKSRQTKASTIPLDVMQAVDLHDIKVEEQSEMSYVSDLRSGGSNHDVNLLSVKVPSLDKLPTAGDGEYECCYCHRFRKFRNQKSWQRHIFDDRRPYVCTFPDCDAPYFGRKDDWFEHELEQHRVQYACPACDNYVARNVTMFRTHVEDRHPALFSSVQIDTVLSVAKTPLERIAVEDCPCCDSWKTRISTRDEMAAVTGERRITVSLQTFKEDLASHLEQLALFALPDQVIEDSDDGEPNEPLSVSTQSSRESLAGSRRTLDWVHDVPQANIVDDADIVEGGHSQGISQSTLTDRSEKKPTNLYDGHLVEDSQAWSGRQLAINLRSFEATNQEVVERRDNFDEDYWRTDATEELVHIAGRQAPTGTESLADGSSRSGKERQEDTEGTSSRITELLREPSEATTDPELLAKGIRSRGRIRGTPGGREELDEGFVIPDKPHLFFVVGRVFRILWFEHPGHKASGVTVITNAGYRGAEVAAKFRWFVVVKNGDNFCSCVPISTYGGRGCGKRSVKKHYHAIAYSGREEPKLLADEEPEPGKPGMMAAIRVLPTDKTEKMPVASRIDFSRVYTIEHYAKCKEFGIVHPRYIKQLQKQWWRVMKAGAENDSIEPADDDDDDDDDERDGSGGPE